MKLGLAGAGRIGAFHAATLNSATGVETLIIADTAVERAKQVADDLGCTAAASIDELFEANLDGLVIAAATDAHAELITRAVDAGLPVFCEKPVASDVAGTVAVLRHVEQAGATVQIGFQRRFDAGYLAARETVRSGSLGWLHTLRATTLDPAPPPAEYVRSSGGFFRDCSVHDFDIIRWLTGQEVAEVYAVGSNRGAEYFAEAGDVDTASAVLTLVDGTLAQVAGTRYNAAGYDVRLEVLGSQDSVAVGLDDRLPLRSTEPGVEWPSGPAYPMFMDRFHDAYAAELRAFTEVVRGDRANPCTVADALESFYVAEACELSRRERRPVALAEVRQG
ncbi:myo-inositol 2-dehydrogenase/D-chiro-inositol 1-dehydrogenase [Tamaricihabitans halophyticus]|uniref:Myo-inositol 2-dehydrogenase/D-chiro-inositol 1-dehydrogenase n=1 Tax=Tamaricihabitans halophyticus TaxID=1262583 RepID=A0A4R2R4N3_9PSEU|nr:Gfo/Idh/MocA family oxidoreductase [Tamaricihabitans halophyticus]TCP54335.1 myo-inositol 2-dehydrogenase/D-chiro-inositol 1-dehydrogenase [Tamaricihabitans halophyticus]